jgi:hypothetical protein
MRCSGVRERVRFSTFERPLWSRAKGGVAGREDEAQQLVAKIVVYGHCYLPARLRASPEFLVAKLGLKIGLSSSCRG